MTTQKTNLDSKLREIIGTVGEAHPGNVCCEHCEKELQLGIAQIHKAFADDGYKQPIKIKDYKNPDAKYTHKWGSTNVQISDMDISHGSNGVTISPPMARQEAYDKVMAEFVKKGVPPDSINPDTRQALKKALGLAK